MKGFCKRIIALSCAIMMSAACINAVGVSAAGKTAAKPIVYACTENGTEYPRTASLSIGYPGGAGYNGNYSLTALYDVADKLVGVGYGTIDIEGKASYDLSIESADAANVKFFVWDDFNTIKPRIPVYETTYAELKQTTVPEFVVPTTDLGIRNSFESGLFHIFQNNGKYNVEIAEGEAYTGTKSAKITGRNNIENSTLRTKLLGTDIQDGTKIDVAAYMKKPVSVQEDAEFYIKVLPVGHSQYAKSSTPVKATDNEWHKVEFSVDFSALNGVGDGIVVQLGARTGSAGSYTHIDYYADDFTIVCPGVREPAVFDDTKIGKLKWDFESGVTSNYVTENRKSSSNVKDAFKWTRALDQQKLTVVDTSAAEFFNTTTENPNVPKELQAGARTTPPENSNKMLQIEAVQPDFANSHVSARVKLSKLDFIPGKTYNLSFWAFGNTKTRGLYAGIIPHDESTGNPPAFTGESNQMDPKGNKVEAKYLAGGIINYSDAEAEYMTNWAAQIQRFWRKYEVKIIPQPGDFNDEGYCELCFVMTEDRSVANDWYFKAIYKGEKLYLDEIELTEAAPESDIAALDNDGLYTKRATFENDNMDMFSPQTRSSVVLTDAEANTGDYSAEFSNRKDNWTALGSSIKGADLSSTITASCYLKKNRIPA